MTYTNVMVNLNSIILYLFNIFAPIKYKTVSTKNTVHWFNKINAKYKHSYRKSKRVFRCNRTPSNYENMVQTRRLFKISINDVKPIISLR